MTGKRPREMRRTVSISSSLSAGSSDGEISPKCESVDQKSACSVLVPRKVIGFNPRIFPEAAEIVPSFLAHRKGCAALPSPRSPRPASGLESLFHSPGPDLDKKSVQGAGLMKKDVDASGVQKKIVSEDVGLGIVAALHSAADAFHACLMGGCRDGELCSASKINDPGMAETQNRAPNSKLTVSMQNQKNPAPDSSKNRLCFKTEGAAASNLNRDLGKQSNSRVAQRSDPKQGFGHALIRQASAPNYVMQDESGLAKVDFLEICFLCKHRLRQGRDIYMYRGDKAFCSVECRHQQILNDERAERREKCSAAALEKGSTGQTRHCEHRDRVISATSGTTAAAA